MIKLNDLRDLLTPIYEDFEIQKEKYFVDTKVGMFLESFSSRVYSKLDLYFRKNSEVFTDDEALDIYSNSYSIRNKFLEFIELIDEINQKGIPFVADKMMLCAYFGINVNIYENFLNSSNEKMQSQFQSIEEYFIANKMQSAEIGTRKNKAITDNLESKRYGHSIEKTQSTTINITNNKMEISSQAVMKKLEKTKFAQIIDATKSK